MGASDWGAHFLFQKFFTLVPEIDFTCAYNERARGSPVAVADWHKEHKA
jgi:hypothetical protein